MVLRRPKTLTDESLLQDEPFKTAFARRNNTKEMRKRADVARSPEQAMIQHEMHSDPGGVSTIPQFISLYKALFMTLQIS